MARSLNFDYKGKGFGLELVKIDRSKLYGDVSLETFDDSGKPCELVTLARDGKTIIAMGGTASGYLSEDGEWVERGDLTATNASGDKLNTVPSTFDVTTELTREVSVEEYLDHAVRLSYLLTPAEGAIDPEFEKALAAGKIFRIDFSYRGGSFADPAFILAGDEGTVWLMIGEPGEVEYVSLSQAGISAANATSESDGDDDSDDFDFDMM
jgi:hypothetical protein